MGRQLDLVIANLRYADHRGIRDAGGHRFLVGRDAKGRALLVDVDEPDYPVLLVDEAHLDRVEQAGSAAEKPALVDAYLAEFLGGMWDG